VVLDAFCGCGTTMVVAEKLKRRWIGIDISFTAIELVKQRMHRLGAVDFAVIGMPTTVEDAKKLEPFDFQNWILRKIHGYPSKRKTGDYGIDGFTLINQYPIQVKKQEKIGRPDLDRFVGAVRRTGKNKGYIIAFSFTSGALAEKERLIREENLTIKLITVEDILKGETVL
jgi:hypothetical protein